MLAKTKSKEKMESHRHRVVQSPKSRYSLMIVVLVGERQRTGKQYPEQGSSDQYLPLFNRQGKIAERMIVAGIYFINL